MWGIMSAQSVAALLILYVGVAAADPCRSATAVLDPRTMEIQILDGEPPAGREADPSNMVVAWANFQDDIMQSGWSYLQVQSNPDVQDDIQAYAAGALEGYLTAHLMENQWQNMFEHYCDDQVLYCTKLIQFIHQNFEYSRRQEQKLRFQDPYWHMVHLQMKQLAGLSDAFDRKTLKPSRHITTMTRAVFFNIVGDLMDLEEAFHRAKDVNSMSQVPSCSGLVKIIGDMEDIYFAHNTWSLYKSMLRIKKKYSLPYHHLPYFTGSDNVVPGHTMTMSSYPGNLMSWDDFYLISSGLAVLETSISNNNEQLWDLVRPDASPLTWVRNGVANRLATTGQEWQGIFSRLNSGTYNNEYMILDYKLFTPGGQIPEGMLWLLEQMPGLIKAEDISHLLQQQTYWPSYNLAYFKEIFEVSGKPPLLEQYGDYFSYDNTPRARLYRRDHVNITDMSSLMRFMRYNDYQNDPLSHCNCTPPQNPIYALAARYDLLDPNGQYDVPDVVYMPVGAIDAKITNSAMMASLEFTGYSGPTYDDQPVFQWSTSGFDVPHVGQPDRWDFAPVDGWGTCPGLQP